jgi:hypothetical protein
LSYHYGSVWPLFTGWTAMAAYRHGRPHVGYQALMANALLTEAATPGSITELISGDLDTAFGRSSPHQIWSQAMVATPLVRGLLGIDVDAGGTALKFAPQLPADWPSLHIRRIAVAGAHYDLDVERTPERDTISVSASTTQPAIASASTATSASSAATASTTAAASTAAAGSTAAASPASAGAPGAAAFDLIVAPAFPLDARISRVTVDGRSHAFTIEREGDVQRVRLVMERVSPARPMRIEIAHTAGTDVIVPIVIPTTGAASEGLRVLRVEPDGRELRLLVEGRPRRTYEITIRATRSKTVPIRFPDATDDYVRQEVRLPVP